MHKKQTFFLNTFSKHITCFVASLFLLQSAQGFTQVMQNKAAIARVQQCLHSAAAKYKFPPALLFAIAEQESGFNPNAVGYTGIAYGLMQIYWNVHRESLLARGVQFNDLFDPCVNAHEGARILNDFMAQHGASWKAVGAYYAGNKFSKEADRRWYAHQIAKRFDYYSKYVTLNTNTGAVARSKSTTPKFNQLSQASKPQLLASNQQIVPESNGSDGIWEAN